MTKDLQEILSSKEAEEVIKTISSMYPDAESKETESFNIRCRTFIIGDMEVSFHYTGDNKVLYSIQ